MFTFMSGNYFDLSFKEANITWSLCQEAFAFCFGCGTHKVREFADSIGPDGVPLPPPPPVDTTEPQDPKINASFLVRHQSSFSSLSIL